MKKERWFNYRPLCLVFGFLVLGSIFAFYCFFDKNNFSSHFMPRTISLITLLVVIGVNIFFAIRNKSLKLLLVPLISLIVGAGMFSICLLTYNSKNFTPPKQVSARIYMVEDHGLTQKVYADNLYFDGIKTKGNIAITIKDTTYQFDNIKVGQHIKFKPNTFSQLDLLYYNEPTAYYYKANIRYSAYANIFDIKFENKSNTLAEIVRNKVKDVLGLGLNNGNTELTYSALFGDKTMLSETSGEAFKLSGTAHLLAVSGLHVGIVVAIINYICKKFKIKGWIKVVLVAALLAFYMYLCDFSTSIVRASVMSIVVLIAPLVYRKYDSLSAISFAGIICFILDPLFAFDAGGVMSFACVFGICFFSNSINKVLSKTKLPQSITQSLAISSSTLISLMFILAYYYKNLNLISLVANIILIPLFTIGFIICFSAGFLGLICKPLGYLLMPVNYLFDAIGLISNILGNLPFANFETIQLHYISTVVYMFLLILMSRITTAKPEHKTMVILPTVAILFAIML